MNSDQRKISHQNDRQKVEFVGREVIVQNVILGSIAHQEVVTETKKWIAVNGITIKPELMIPAEYRDNLI